MNPVERDTVNGAFRALADPTRREILMMLRERNMTVAEVARHFDITRPAVKKHLTVLEEGGLIGSTPRGRERINALRPEGLRTAAQWLRYFDQFWDERLDALRDAIETQEDDNS